jgi:hypothetical protein
VVAIKEEREREEEAFLFSGKKSRVIKKELIL